MTRVESNFRSVYFHTADLFRMLIIIMKRVYIQTYARYMNHVFTFVIRKVDEYESWKSILNHQKNGSNNLFEWECNKFENKKVC